MQYIYETTTYREKKHIIKEIMWNFTQYTENVYIK